MHSDSGRPEVNTIVVFFVELSDSTTIFSENSPSYQRIHFVHVCDSYFIAVSAYESDVCVLSSAVSVDLDRHHLRARDDIERALHGILQCAALCQILLIFWFGENGPVFKPFQIFDELSSQGSRFYFTHFPSSTPMVSTDIARTRSMAKWSLEIRLSTRQTSQWVQARSALIVHAMMA